MQNIDEIQLQNILFLSSKEVIHFYYVVVFFVWRKHVEAGIGSLPSFVLDSLVVLNFVEDIIPILVVLNVMIYDHQLDSI